jgi:hypothetical protein
MQIGVLPHAQDSVSGCVFVPAAEDKNQPSANGPLIYLNCDGRLDAAIAEVEKNGGKLLQSKHPIGPYGFRAIVTDSEGNRVALHSQKA